MPQMVASLIGEMVICSLTLAAPYYDCSEMWTIYMYDFYPYQECENLTGQSKVISCADLQTNSIHYVVYQPQVWIDYCDNTILVHELNHLKFNDANYCH